MACMVWYLALLGHACAHVVQCQEVASVTWAQVFVGLIVIVLGIGIIYIIGYIFTHALLWTFQMQTGQALEEFLGQQPRLELLLSVLHVAVLVAGVTAFLALVSMSFSPVTEGISALQGFILLPKHPLECSFQALLPASLPSFMPPLQCQEWYDATWIALGALVALVALFLCGIYLLLQGEWKSFLLGGTWPAIRVASLLTGSALASGLLISGYLAERFQPLLDGYILLPKSLHTCSLQIMIDVPLLLPVHAGTQISKQDLDARREYFVSLLLWLTVAAFLVGVLLTCLKRTCRRSSDAGYGLINSASMTISPVEHVSVHLLCAGIVTWFVGTDRLNIYKGICWEAYVMWVFVMLFSSILQASYVVLVLPLQSKVPNFGMAIIESTLPILGEPLDTFKDWIFLGLAASTNHWLGYMFASCAALIMLVSTLRLRKHHHEAVARSLLPVRSVCHPGSETSILVKQTSPSKLAVTLTEDLPQALLQSAFVAFFGGSATQFAFIGLSVAKIVVCVSLRAVILKQEDRHGEAWASSMEYYHLKIQAYSLLLGSKHPWVLQAQAHLALNLYHLERHQESLDLRQTVLEVSHEVLGPKHPETLKASSDLAWSLVRLNRSAEALDLFEMNLVALVEVLGPRHGLTLISSDGKVMALRQLGRDAEALQLNEEVLQVMREALGPGHFETLKAQHNLAKSLLRLKRSQEALEQFQEVLRLQREVLGPKDPKTLVTRFNVALALRDLGRSCEAMEVLKELLALQGEVLGPQHPRTLDTEKEYQKLVKLQASNP